MTNHIEISALIPLDQIANSALTTTEVAGGFRTKRKSNFPISVAEREHAISALSLLFIAFEGYINRVIYLLSQDNQTLVRQYNNPNVVERLKVLLGNSNLSRHLVKLFNEALALRNAIVHGHLYETERTRERKILKKSHLIMHPNNTYINHVNQNTYRTKTMYLHVMPSEIGIEDVYKMIMLWNKIYIRLNVLHGNFALLQMAYPHEFATRLNNSGRVDKFDELEHLVIYSQGLLAIPECMKRNYLVNK